MIKISTVICIKIYTWNNTEKNIIKFKRLKVQKWDVIRVHIKYISSRIGHRHEVAIELPKFHNHGVRPERWGQGSISRCLQHILLLRPIQQRHCGGTSASTLTFNPNLAGHNSFVRTPILPRKHKWMAPTDLHSSSLESLSRIKGINGTHLHQRNGGL